MDLYSYKGPVVEFERCIANNWVGKTYAPSEKKARSNLAHQFKQENGKTPTSKISLPGKIIRVE
jgi:hypothetical protein